MKAMVRWLGAVKLSVVRAASRLAISMDTSQQVGNLSMASTLSADPTLGRAHQRPGQHHLDARHAGAQAPGG